LKPPSKNPQVTPPRSAGLRFLPPICTVLPVVVEHVADRIRVTDQGGATLPSLMVFVPGLMFLVTHSSGPKSD